MDLYRKAYSDALHANEAETARWATYRNEHIALKEHLRQYQESLRVDILVPIGTKALVPGQLCHTGEVLVSHGAGYFSECSAAQGQRIADRRIAIADGMLQRYDRERTLFSDKMVPPFAEDAFGGPEIVEEYDEQAEQRWREEHRQRVREQKQREATERAENRKQQQQQPQDPEEGQDWLQKLEELELMEELEEELEKLDVTNETDEQLARLMRGEIKVQERQRTAHGASEPIEEELITTDEESSGTDEAEDVSPEFVQLLTDTKTMNRQDKVGAFRSKLADIAMRLKLPATSMDEKVNLYDLQYEIEEALDFLEPSPLEEREQPVRDKKSRRIQFADTDQVKLIDSRESHATQSQTLELHIVHSPVTPGTTSEEPGELRSPADIYRLFGTPSPEVETKSILKNREKVRQEIHHREPAPAVQRRVAKPSSLPPVEILGDVYEHSTESTETSKSAEEEPATTGSKKKVSKFRMQRR